MRPVRRLTVSPPPTALNSATIAPTPTTAAKPSKAVPALRHQPQVAPPQPATTAPPAFASQPVSEPEHLEVLAAPDYLTRPNAVLVAPSARLLYDVSASSKGRNIAGQSELLWQNTGQDYDARWVLQLPGTVGRVQTSVGRISADGLAPIRFADKARAEQAAHFERERTQIVFSANAPTAALLEGAQDRLSVLLQLGAMLAAEPARFSAGARLAVQTAGPRDAAIWRFAVGETESLALPGGELAGVKLTHRPQGLYEPQLELWLAPALGYLPVRWRLNYGNGDWIDHQWRAREVP